MYIQINLMWIVKIDMEHSNKINIRKLLKTKKLYLYINKIEYMVQNFKTFGIGHSNTCVFKFIGVDITLNDVLVIQYFILSGLGVCFRI